MPIYLSDLTLNANKHMHHFHLQQPNVLLIVTGGKQQAGMKTKEPLCLKKEGWGVYSLHALSLHEYLRLDH